MAITDDERVVRVLERTSVLSDELTASVAELVELLCGAGEPEQEPRDNDD